MLEPLPQFANGLRELARDCISRMPPPERGVVRLVQDKKRAGAKLAEYVTQAGRIYLIREQPVRDDEARAGRPGIYGEAAKPAHLADRAPCR